MTTSADPILSVNNLRVEIGSKTILDGITFDMMPTEIVALVGPNGSGKTTLIRSVLDLVKSTGQIAWWRRGYTDRKWWKIADRVAFVAQSPTVLEGQTVFETILLAYTSRLMIWPRDIEWIESLAKWHGLLDLLDRRIETLSGGQRQRVFLVRALVRSPSTLILDEPATFLDLKHQTELHHRLRRLTTEDGLTVLMASHDLNLVAQHADRMILLHEGKIAAQGTPSEVLDPVLISRVFETPMKRIDVDGKPMLVVSDQWPEFRRV